MNPKHLLPVFFAILLLLGCSQPRQKKPLYRWMPVSTAYDSLSVSLENAYATGKSYDTKKLLTEALCSAASITRNVPARVQTGYWEARLAKAAYDIPKADSLVTDAMERCDSAHYPYEFARLVSIKASLGNIPPKDAYRMASSNLAYFEAEEDSFMMGATLMRLGAIMWSISDTVPAANYYRRADTIYTRMGMEYYRVMNLLNIANIYDRPEDKAIRDSLMKFLLHSRIAKSDPDLYHNVLRNAYLMTEDLDYLKRAYRTVGKAPRYDSENAFYEGAIADYYLDKEIYPESIAIYARKGLSKIDKVNSHFTRAMIFNALAFTNYMEGDVDTSLYFYREFLDSRLRIEQERYSLQTTKDEYRAIFEKERAEEQHRHSREKAYWIAALIVLVTLAAGAVTALYFRAQKARLSRQKWEIELQRHRNHLSACALAMEEKDGIINTVVKCVDRMSAENKIGASEAREITMAMRQYLNSHLERETFRELHEKLHPEFMKRLKADYPMLTESLLKHAAYITMGMTSKQISQALNIEYDSVKKSRSRLRQRMGLAPEDSLEDILRGYS